MLALIGSHSDVLTLNQLMGPGSLGSVSRCFRRPVTKVN